MGNKLYVGNLAFSATEDTVSELFSRFGNVDSCRLITDRDTGRSKGFGFVEMSSDAEALNAANELNGQEFEGRALTVNEARPQAPRGGSSYSGNAGSGNSGYSSRQNSSGGNDGYGRGSY